jgi:hypothetical protein
MERQSAIERIDAIPILLLEGTKDLSRNLKFRNYAYKLQVEDMSKEAPQDSFVSGPTVFQRANI